MNPLLLALHFLFLTFEVSALASMALYSRLLAPRFLAILEFLVFIPVSLEIACAIELLSSNPLELLHQFPILAATNYLVELVGILYLGLFVYSEVLHYRDDGRLNFIFQTERDNSDNEEVLPQPRYSRFSSNRRSAKKPRWPQQRDVKGRYRKVSPKLYLEDPQEYTERRVQELNQYQQFRDMKNETIPSRWKHNIPEPSETQYTNWLEEYAGRRDLFSSQENVFAENAFDDPEDRRSGKLQTMHNQRISSTSVSPLRKVKTLSHFKFD